LVHRALRKGALPRNFGVIPASYHAMAVGMIDARFNYSYSANIQFR
jgi:hypothetical protein